MPSNLEFVNAIFGADAPWCHVTDFTYDPNNIPSERHLAAWSGDYFSRYSFESNSNQYFTISCFYAYETKRARRRKVLFRHTNCIVLDDVREKLSLSDVERLPSPSWVLETSPGSEQWGYILDTPCTDRAKVENLLDGLVANGLAPDGRDPGMKGVTRYVRLPEGYNTKASKMVDGQPFKCQMLKWEPFTTTTMEQLAQPFHVDLDAPRREARIDGATDIPDHPLLQIPEIIKVKEVRSDGRFDITCPWVIAHTGEDDSGSAIFTNDDGSIGFKCHHGSCQHRTGRDLFKVIEAQQPGFGTSFANWRVMHSFASEVNFFGTSGAQAPLESTGGSDDKLLYGVDRAGEEVGTKDNHPAHDGGVQAGEPDFRGGVVNDDVPRSRANTSTSTSGGEGLDVLLNQLRTVNPSSSEARSTVSTLLQLVDALPALDKKHWHDQVCDIMHWSKADFKPILRDLREQWYTSSKEVNFYNDVVYIMELNQFYSFSKRIFFTAEGFQNSFAHEDAEARKEALQEGMVAKVDKIDYAPKRPRIFEEGGIKYANTWSASGELQGVPGDVQRWLDHWDALGWAEHRGHMLRWMAFTIIHPDIKINHMLMLGSGEGCGKDFLLYPLIKAMGDNSTTIDGESLLRDFNSHIMGTKHLHINEAELGSRQEAQTITNRLKPLAAAPPDTLRVNQKGIKEINVRNIVNCSMTTNSRLPLRLTGVSRRFFAVWSDLNMRNEYDEMQPAWLEYWKDRWTWMKGEGVAACIHYLKTQVDLNQFDPCAPPPMTEFLRQIQEDSKSPMQVTIEEFIRRRPGIFQSDLLTASDMSSVLRAAEMIDETRDMLSTEARMFTPTRVGSILRDMPQCKTLRAHKRHTNVRLWVIRDFEKYESMSGVELINEYEQQMQKAKKSSGLTVVR